MNQQEVTTEKTTPYLSFTDSVKPYETADIGSVFVDMSRELAKPISHTTFETVSSQVGSHLPKLVNPQSKSAPIDLRSPFDGNRVRAAHFSGNAADSKAAKIILRPIAIVGCEERSFLSHIEAPDANSAALEAAFDQAFGTGAADAVRRGLATRKTNIDRVAIHPTNFPVFFIPGPGGSDLQATPMASGDTFMAMRQLRSDLLVAAKAARQAKSTDRIFVGDWVKTDVSAQLQNAAPSLKGPRVRFLAVMPEIMADEAAGMHAFIKGGRFPRLFDERAVSALKSYAARVHAITDGGYVNPAIEDGLAKTARVAIRAAVWHVEDTLSEAMDADPGGDHHKRAPSVSEVLIASIHKTDPDRTSVVTAMRAPRFRAILSAMELAQC